MCESVSIQRCLFFHFNIVSGAALWFMQASGDFLVVFSHKLGEQKRGD
jgi:hypothetical protein